MKTLNEIAIGEYIYEDLDLIYPAYDSPRAIKNEVSYDNDIYSESPPISIKVLEEMLEDLKIDGATHLYAVSHTDHHGYTFTGVKYEQI